MPGVQAEAEFAKRVVDGPAEWHELGFDTCTVVSNERDAIDLAKSDPPDVVVMDVYLNGTRAGIEAARWLREVCGLPVVFMTAFTIINSVYTTQTIRPPATLQPAAFEKPT